MWYVYVVRCSDGSLYTGVTTDIVKRVKAHNAGRGAKYTRTRLRVVLVYYEGGRSRSDALRRERQIKRMKKADKERLVSP